MCTAFGSKINFPMWTIKYIILQYNRYNRPYSHSSHFSVTSGSGWEAVMQT